MNFLHLTNIDKSRRGTLTKLFMKFTTKQLFDVLLDITFHPHLDEVLHCLLLLQPEGPE